MGRSQACRKSFIHLGNLGLDFLDNRFRCLGVLHWSSCSLLLMLRLVRTVHAENIASKICHRGNGRRSTQGDETGQPISDCHCHYSSIECLPRAIFFVAALFDSFGRHKLTSLFLFNHKASIVFKARFARPSALHYASISKIFFGWPIRTTLSGRRF